MKTKLLAFGFLVYALAILGWSHYAKAHLRPPYDAEFRQMAIYSYSYYDSHHEAPRNVEHLPPELRRLVDDGRSGINWDSKTLTLSYTYPREYPLNIGLIRVLTFGFIPGSSPMTLGTSISPDLMAHNAKVYKDAGKLVAQ